MLVKSSWVRPFLAPVSIALGCGLVAAACGGGDGDGGGGGGAAGQGAGGAGGAAGAGPASPATQFLTDYAAAVCAMYQPCCETGGLGFDQAGCTDWFQRVTAAYWNGGGSDGGEYRPDRGEACLRALAEARGADANRCQTVALFDEATLRAECQQAISPPVREGQPPGGTCLSGSECAGSADGTVMCYARTCVVTRRGQAGDGPCNLSAGTAGGGPPAAAFTCEPGDNLYCDRTSNVCAPRVGDGERCPFANACSEASLCTGGLCHRLPAIGEPCLNAVPGAGGFCRAGSVCDVVTLICAPGRAVGEPCNDPNQCATRVCLDGACAASDFTKNLNCVGGLR